MVGIAKPPDAEAQVAQSPQGPTGLFGLDFAAWLWQALEAWFIDMPHLVDSLVRHTEYRINRTHDYDPGPVAQGSQDPIAVISGITPAGRVSPAQLALLLATLVFVVYGPTFRSVCGAGGEAFNRFVVCLVTLAVAAVGMSILWHFKAALTRVEQRADEVRATLFAGGRY